MGSMIQNSLYACGYYTVITQICNPPPLPRDHSPTVFWGMFEAKITKYGRGLPIGERGDYNYRMICKNCNNILTGKQTKYCSLRCGKLFLKREYKRRNRDKINAYARKYRKKGIRTAPKIPKQYLICAKCGTTKGIEKCHVKPRVLGGKHLYNVVMFCHKHHSQFDQALRGFWYV